LGLELDGQEVNWDQQTQSSNFKQETISGGPIYTLARYRAVRPYAKFLIDFGGLDFTINSVPNYKHDTRTAYASGGFQVRTYPHLWVRLDFEYQIWQPFFSTTKRRTPQGFTLGASWDVGHCAAAKPTHQVSSPISALHLWA
jgi:hypothetical protein